MTAPTATEVITYTQGMCGHLALAINEVTGWQLVVYVYEEGHPADSMGFGWCHAMVRRPDDLILDVRGLQTDQEVHAHWGPIIENGCGSPGCACNEYACDPYLRHVTAEELGRVLYVRDEDREMAQRLLALYPCP